MKRLFILGNGFDLAHGLKTSYEDFKEYLIKKYKYTPMSSDIVSFSKEQQVSLIIDMINNVSEGELWKDIESAVGRIDMAFPYYLCDNFDYSEQWKYGLIISDCLILITKVFSEWVDTIKFDKSRLNSQFEKLFSSASDAFLTFNYTTVLEDIYDVTNICHIHGIQHKDKVFGHGQTLTPAKEYWLREDLNSEIVYTWNKLKKDALSQIERNIDFFNQMVLLKEIYSYGFSFSNPDMLYIKEICKNTDSDTIWYLSSYENETIQNQYKRIIRDAGFEGEFQTFRINKK